MTRRRRGPWQRLMRATLEALAASRARIGGWRQDHAPPPVELDAVRRRLELVLTALHGRAIPIEAIGAPRGGVLVRTARSLMGSNASPGVALAAVEGTTIRLPPRIAGASGAIAHYRLLAMEQAERLVRGTGEAAARTTSRLERDLYFVRESMAVDAQLQRRVRSVGATLREARREARADRPTLDGMSAAERAVELHARAALDGPPDAALADSSPADSLQWARERAAELVSRGRYRGLAPIAHWGVLPPLGSAGPAGEADGPLHRRPDPYAPKGAPGGPGAIASIRPGRPSGDQGSAPEAGGSSEAVTDPRGDQTTGSAARATREASDGVDDPAKDDPAPVVPARRSGDAAALHPDDAVSRPHADDDEAVEATPGTEYPEWHHGQGRYLPRAVTVREIEPVMADGSWSRTVLRRNAALVRRIRERFEPLRAQRTRLGRQLEGEELDVPACVQALVDARTGHTPDERLYVAVRPARRGMAIMLLVDVSGSTDAPVSGGQRIIDVEKIAVLLASEAFDALGDVYAVATFSSRGARDVRVTTLKDFREPNGARVHQRVEAITPRGNTRLGAAVRHAAARLARAQAERRLLLILSDGRPNDVDHYHEAFGVEDARQAIHEARAQGIYPFCLTIDTEGGPAYLSRVFGPHGHTTIRDAEQLPLALVRVVQQLLAR